MIRKIISGGQTGADRAALDTAIKFNIDHGGVVPKGRRTEDGRLPDVYRMEEDTTPDYDSRTEKNVRAAQATVIIARGPLAGGSRLTEQMARLYKKPLCLLDLAAMDEFEAAVTLHGFIRDNHIETLNVAGPRAGQDPGIYWSAKGILETLVFMEMMDEAPVSIPTEDTLLMERRSRKKCKTVEGAVSFIVSELHLRTRCMIANLNSRQIKTGYFALADSIKVKLGLEEGNTALIDRCARRAGMDSMTPEDAAMVIFKAVKSQLEKDHVLRVVP